MNPHLNRHSPLSAATLLPNSLYQSAFGGPRTARSHEYKAGVYDALRFRAGVEPMRSCPHPVGTAQADAWYSGVEEGHARWTAHLAADELQQEVI